MRSLVFSLLLPLPRCRTNIRVVNDLRHYSAHMMSLWCVQLFLISIYVYVAYGVLSAKLSCDDPTVIGLTLSYHHILHLTSKLLGQKYMDVREYWSENYLQSAVIQIQIQFKFNSKVELSWPTATSSNGNIFRVTGPLWREFTSHRRIPLTKASDAELWWFLCSAPE